CSLPFSRAPYILILHAFPTRRSSDLAPYIADLPEKRETPLRANLAMHLHEQLVSHHLTPQQTHHASLHPLPLRNVTPASLSGLAIRSIAMMRMASSYEETQFSG